MGKSRMGWVALVPSFMGQGQWELLSHIYFYSSQTETITQTLNIDGMSSSIPTSFRSF